MKILIEKEFGYPFEKHTYETADGCLNTVMRIPGPKGTPNTVGVGKKKIVGKPVAIYQHGFVDSCAGIICSGENSLGLRLVNAGFDLWLPNSRGNRYSKGHMNADDELFERGFDK